MEETSLCRGRTLLYLVWSYAQFQLLDEALYHYFRHFNKFIKLYFFLDKLALEILSLREILAYSLLVSSALRLQTYDIWIVITSTEDQSFEILPFIFLFIFRFCIFGFVLGRFYISHLP